MTYINIDSKNIQIISRQFLTQHIETIVGSVNTHKDVHMKNIRNTRKKEQKRCHQDYMKEGRNYGLHISVRKPGRNSARFFGTL